MRHSGIKNFWEEIEFPTGGNHDTLYMGDNKGLGTPQQKHPNYQQQGYRSFGIIHNNEKEGVIDNTRSTQFAYRS